MKNGILMTSVCLMICWLGITPVHASFEDRGTGARPAALAGAFSASAGDVFGIDYNPAGIAQLGSVQLGLSFFRLFQVADFSTFFAAFGMPVGHQQTVAVTEQFFGNPGYYFENTLSGTYARQILGFRDADSINTGLTVRYLHKSSITGLGDHSMSGCDGFALDAGVLVISKILPTLALQAGFVFAFKSIDNEESLFTAALSVSLIDRFLTTLDFAMTENIVRVGEEIAVIPHVLFVRGGLKIDKMAVFEKDVGLGWSADRMAFDYAVQSFQDDPGLTHRFSASLDF